MDKRKIIVGIIILLIFIITGWFFLSVIKNSRKQEKAPLPVTEAKKELVKTEKSDVIEGQFKKISGQSLTLQTESGEKTINIQESKTKFFVKGKADAPVETPVGELKEGTEVTVIYAETKEQEMPIASGVFRGVITNISGGKITLKSESETKTFTIGAEPTVYMTKGANDVTKKISDLRTNSLVSVIYASDNGELVALGIRIDKL